jgi:ribosome biogenesis protein Nip4
MNLYTSTVYQYICPNKMCTRVFIKKNLHRHNSDGIKTLSMISRDRIQATNNVELEYLFLFLFKQHFYF